MVYAQYFTFNLYFQLIIELQHNPDMSEYMKVLVYCVYKYKNC